MLDTNVLVAAVRSRRGASFAVLGRVGGEDFDLAVSVPLVVEYEAALLRHQPATELSPDDVLAIVDFICLVAKPQAIFFLWRPLLRDPGDDMVAEAAIAAGADGVVTYNRADFAELARLGVRIMSPQELLRESP